MTVSNHLRTYLYRNFQGIFFPLFVALTAIAAIVLFIQISTMTSFLKITFSEMLLFFSYQIPDIFLYTLPISFFAAGVMTLSKLSFDLELIVLFALGSRAIDILRPFFYLALLLTVTLLVLGVWLKPKTLYQAKEFVYKKRDTAQVNIRPSEFGQKFGDWLLFIGHQTGQERFSDIVLFSKNRDGEFFIKSEQAKIENLGYRFQLRLDQGQVYQIMPESIRQISYDQMTVNETARLGKLSFSGIVAFWEEEVSKGKAKELAYHVLIALFPLLSLPAILAFGVINPRQQKNRSYLFIIAGILVYYVMAFTVGAQTPLYSVPIVTVLWLLFAGFIYRRRVSGRY